MVVKPLACCSVNDAPSGLSVGRDASAQQGPFWGQVCTAAQAGCLTLCTWPSQRQGEELSHIAVGGKDMPIK